MERAASMLFSGVRVDRKKFAADIAIFKARVKP